MKLFIPVVIVVATAVLALAGILSPSQVGAVVGEEGGSSFTRSFSGGSAPEEVVSSFLQNVQRRDWDAAYAQLATQNKADEPSFVRELAGSNGSLRTFSSLANWDLKPMHASDT